MHDASVPKGELRITVIATGFQDNIMPATIRVRGRSLTSTLNQNRHASMLNSNNSNGRFRRLELLKPSYLRRKLEDK